MTKSEIKNVPCHVGLIMDGNRRWAKKRLLPAAAGHSAGLNRMVKIAERSMEIGVKYLTVYALSTENLLRAKDELEKMFELIIKNFAANVKKLTKLGAAVKVIGNLSLLPENVRQTITDALKTSPETADFTFIMAIGYGARDEIVQAANSAIKSGESVDEDGFARHLYSVGIPDPDFIIRTGGELRLSNFLLWQAAYAELYFTDTLFPDFTNAKFDKAIEEYSARIRRFGKS